MFSTKTEELVVLRVFSKALVRKLLPESLWGLQLYHCALNEIVALNALGLLVIWFSDPDNLNQMIVKFLGTGIPKSSEYKQNDESANQSENTSLNSFRDDSEEDQSSGEKKTQKKTQKKIWKRVLTQPWSSAKEKLKQLKKKKKKKLKNESFSEMCSPAMLMNSNDGSSSSREGSTGSQLNSDNDESMSEDRMEFELSYKMWQFGEWAVTVTSFQKENEQSCFVIHVEEKLGHEHLQWDVKKTEAEIISFIKEGLGKECPIKKDENMDEEKTKDILERLLQELVSDETLGKSEQVFQFLFPLNRLLQENETHGLMWDFLSNLFYMLTTTPEEENVTVETDVGQGISDESELDHMDDFQIPKDNRVCEDAKSVDQKHSATRDDPVKAQVMDLPMKNVKEPQPALKDVNKTNDGDTVTTCANDDPSPVVHSNKREPAMMSFTQSDPGSHQSVENKSKNNDKSPEKKPKRMSDPKQLKREPKNSEAITAAVDLLKEISGSVLFLKLIEHIANTLSLGKSKVTRFLDALNPTEDQMAGYIDSICESQWPNGLPCEPAPPRTPEEKQLTRRQAFDFITKKNSEWGLKLLISKSNLETVFKIFQETEENKRLVYMLLFDLLRKFLPEETALNDISKRYVIDFSKGKEKQS
ncbi:uncharacterized protein LOC114768178 isoform X2 [Denticeps clupeoides]|nr:uncharacterized protein LOC114768178 isoform X2 [Denticeps clupeoides]